MACGAQTAEQALRGRCVGHRTGRSPRKVDNLVAWICRVATLFGWEHGLMILCIPWQFLAHCGCLEHVFDICDAIFRNLHEDDTEAARRRGGWEG